MSETGVCRSCGAAIIWAKNDKTGKVAPIDAGGNPDGPVILLPGGKYRVLTATERVGNPAVRTLRYTNHWQTCRDRKDWKEVYRR